MNASSAWSVSKLFEPWGSTNVTVSFATLAACTLSVGICWPVTGRSQLDPGCSATSVIVWVPARTCRGTWRPSMTSFPSGSTIIPSASRRCVLFLFRFKKFPLLSLLDVSLLLEFIWRAVRWLWMWAYFFFFTLLFHNSIFWRVLKWSWMWAVACGSFNWSFGSFYLFFCKSFSYFSSIEMVMDVSSCLWFI